MGGGGLCGETGYHTAFPNKEKMVSLFFIKNVQLAKRKGHAAGEQKEI